MRSEREYELLLQKYEACAAANHRHYQAAKIAQRYATQLESELEHLEFELAVMIRLFRPDLE